MWMLPTMGDIRRWLGLCLAIGYYFMFVFTMERKYTTECDCVKATKASREFLNPIARRENDDKIHGLHVGRNSNRIYRDVGYW
jgi:hypothetical protein